MFKHSLDEYIASERRAKADRLLDEIHKKSHLQMSDKIDQALTNYKLKNISFLKGVHDLAKECHEEMVIVVSPQNILGHTVLMDFKTAFDKLKKSWKDIIPYVEYTFLEGNGSGSISHSSKHSFIFFFTKYHEFEASEECVLYYLQRFNKIKVFT